MKRRAEFLREAACYFEKRDTGGEDMAFWANHQNAENCRKIADALEAKAARVTELETLCERLKLEAQMHSGESRAHKSTVHECYQAASGATGEPGNWHGATPVRDRIASLKAQLEAFRAAGKEVLPALEFYKNPEVYKPDSTGRIGDLTFRAYPAIRILMSALQNAEGEKDGVE